MRYIGFAMLGAVFGWWAYAPVRDAVRIFGWKTVITAAGMVLGSVVWSYVAWMLILER